MHQPNCRCLSCRMARLGLERIVTPGHDVLGRERGFVHLYITHPVEPDFDILIQLHEQYNGMHPEWTLGGAQYTHVEPR